MERIEINGMSFWTRPGTVDVEVLNEVIRDDGYSLRKLHLRSNPNIIDIGGHIGSFTRFALNRWPKAMVHTFEANPRNWEIIGKNLEPVADRVTLYKGACVGREPVNKRLVISKGSDRHTGGWGIIFADHPFELPDHDMAEPIKDFFYLPDLIPTMDKVDLLKMDCEGSEWSIIKELPEEMFRRIDYIVCELHCGALPHVSYTYKELRDKILAQFICPELEQRPVCGPDDLFCFVACNHRLLR